MSRVAITGIGIVDSLGSDKDTCFNNLCNNYNPIKEITKIDFDQYSSIKTRIGAEINSHTNFNLKQLTEQQASKLPLFAKAALHAANQAIEDANLSNNNNAAVIYSTLGSEATHRIGCIVALTNNKSKYPPKSLLEVQLDHAASVVSQTIGINGPSVSFNSSCATFLHSLDYARRLVDEYDYVIVGAADTMIDPVHMFWFQQFHALSPDGSRPFDKMRNGFVMGDGAGCLILESEEKAKSRGARIYGFIAGLGLATELESQTGLNKEAARLALKRALTQSKIDKVDFISAHATSTTLGDQVEYDVMNEILPNTPMYSAKGKIGHTMGACGALETIYALQSLNNSIIPRTFNLTNPLAYNPNLITNNLHMECSSFVKNSYAFGGKCASLIVTK